MFTKFLSDYRRRGFAKKMLVDIESRLLGLGVSWAQLSVFSFNQPAQQLYRESGYGELHIEMAKWITGR